MTVPTSSGGNGGGGNGGSGGGIVGGGSGYQRHPHAQRPTSAFAEQREETWRANAALTDEEIQDNKTKRKDQTWSWRTLEYKKLTDHSEVQWMSHAKEEMLHFRSMVNVGLLFSIEW